VKRVIYPENIDNLVEREPMSGCWLWLRSINRLGYGAALGSLAHRVVYQWFRGSVDKDMDVMHLCHNRCCVNPNHMRVGTRQENVQMSVDDGRWNKKLRSKKQAAVRKLETINGHIVGRFRNVTDEQIRIIRSIGLTSKARKELADEYGITPTAIRAIQIGKVYKYV